MGLPCYPGGDYREVRSGGIHRRLWYPHVSYDVWRDFQLRVSGRGMSGWYGGVGQVIYCPSTSTISLQLALFIS